MICPPLKCLPSQCHGNTRKPARILFFPRLYCGSGISDEKRSQRSSEDTFRIRPGLLCCCFANFRPLSYPSKVSNFRRLGRSFQALTFSSTPVAELTKTSSCSCQPKRQTVTDTHKAYIYIFIQFLSPFPNFRGLYPPVGSFFCGLA